MSVGRFILRSTVGALMVGHGLQKLQGSFNGPGLEGTEKMMESIGLYPPKQQALAVALTETIGGGLTATGLFSPLGPAMITGSMAVAIHKVHMKNGLWAQDGGFEYNLTLIAAAFALACEGPGLVSGDGIVRHQRAGLRWGILELLLGVGGAAGVVALANSLAARQNGGSGDVSTDSSQGDSTPLPTTEATLGERPVLREA